MNALATPTQPPNGNDAILAATLKELRALKQEIVDQRRISPNDDFNDINWPRLDSLENTLMSLSADTLGGLIVKIEAAYMLFETINAWSEDDSCPGQHALKDVLTNAKMIMESKASGRSGMTHDPEKKLRSLVFDIESPITRAQSCSTLLNNLLDYPFSIEDMRPVMVRILDDLEIAMVDARQIFNDLQSRVVGQS